MNYLYACPPGGVAQATGARAFAQTPFDSNPFYVDTASNLPFLSSDGAGVERPGGFVSANSTLATQVNIGAVAPLLWSAEAPANPAASYPPAVTNPLNYNYVNGRFSYYNNRWLNIYTLIPAALTPLPGIGDFWSLQYVSNASPSDRVTAEVAIVGEPPRIQQ